MSAWGGRNAVIDLGDQIARMRGAHPGAVPIVQLRAGEMKTRFGKKSKPMFRVVAWKAADGDPAATAAVALPKATAAPIDDDIPF